MHPSMNVVWNPNTSLEYEIEILGVDLVSSAVLYLWLAISLNYQPLASFPITHFQIFRWQLPD